MSILVSAGSVVSAASQSIALSRLVTVAAASGNPAYLVLNGFDRNEYTAGASGAVGSFSGNGHQQSLSYGSGDARQAGIVFHYDSTTGRYSNATYGYLDQLSFTSSGSAGDVTDLSLFATSSASLASSYANNVIGLAQADASGYLGTVTLVTAAAAAASAAAATPDSIASVAQRFVGASWNSNGCWVLTSTIAAEAGASLPVQSTATSIAGAAGGEWIVAYNGPAGASGDWRAMVHTGDMVGFVTSSGTGHITTCVSGSGSSAMLIDNLELVDSSGRVINASSDGSSSDVVIQPAHAASQEWSGVQASSVVIYRLDTPLVSAAAAQVTVAAGASAQLGTLFSASDPAGRTITEYQVYTASTQDQIAAGGTISTATDAASAITLASLSSASLLRSAAAGTDTVEMRAYNGQWWGDWTAISVAGAAAASATAPQPASPAAPAATAPASAAEVSVYRFFDTADGTHFFTASASERDSILASRPDLAFEGVGLQAYAAPADSAAVPVYRFFDTTDGTHFFTASASERDSILATRPDYTAEGVAFYEDATAQTGDQAVYRFFDTAHGTHLFTTSESERASILSSRPDLVSEGIAFYAPA